jgi:hypothetical protein
MTRVGDICTVLQDIDDALTGKFERTTSPNVDPLSAQSLLDGDAYFIGRKDRSEDMIPSIPLWVNKQRQDDAVKVSYYSLLPTQLLR